MSPAEKLFFPILLFLTFLGYLHFFLCMLPGLGAALLLGYFNALVLFPRWAPKLPRRETAGGRGGFRRRGAGAGGGPPGRGGGGPGLWDFFWGF